MRDAFFAAWTMETFDRPRTRVSNFSISIAAERWLAGKSFIQIKEGVIESP